MHNVFGVFNKWNVLIIFVDAGTVHHVSIYTVEKTSVEIRMSHVMTYQERDKLCSNLALYPQPILHN